MGDKLLKEAANRLQSCIRSNDYAFRIGGDEFAAVIEGVSENSPEECSRLLAGQVEAYGKENGFKAGIAWGYAGSDPGSKENFSELLSRADHNMYEMKKQDVYKRQDLFLRQQHQQQIHPGFEGCAGRKRFLR